MTGLTSVSSSTRSPIIMACPCIGLNAIQPPSAKAGLIATPSKATTRSLRGKPYRCTSPVTAAFLPKASSTFCQSVSCALAAEADKTARIEIIIQERLRIALFSLLSMLHDCDGSPVNQPRCQRVHLLQRLQAPTTRAGQLWVSPCRLRHQV